MAKLKLGGLLSVVLSGAGSYVLGPTSSIATNTLRWLSGRRSGPAAAFSVVCSGFFDLAIDPNPKNGTKLIFRDPGVR